MFLIKQFHQFIYSSDKDIGNEFESVKVAFHCISKAMVLQPATSCQIVVLKTIARCDIGLLMPTRHCTS